MKEPSNLIITPLAHLGEPVQTNPFKNSLVVCDLSLSQEECDALSTLQIQQDKTFSFFGSIEDLDPTKIEEFLREVSGGEQAGSSIVSQLVSMLANNAVQLVGNDSAWVDLRAGSDPEPYFDIPRWHQDGTFFSPSPQEGYYKFATALKGATTRFARIRDLDRYKILQAEYGRIVERLFGLDQKGEANTVRLELDSVVEEIDTKELRGAFFLVANENACAHSEPIIDEPRLFMSVLPGTLDQIESLRKRWQKAKLNVS
jgi:hypothetical protein